MVKSNNGLIRKLSIMLFLIQILACTDSKFTSLHQKCLDDWQLNNISFSESPYTTYSLVSDVCGVRVQLSLEGYRVTPYIKSNDFLYYRNTGLDPKKFSYQIKKFLKKDPNNIF
jgi:hypothetical protein